MQYLAPYLCFSWWLFAVAVAAAPTPEDTEDVAEGEWEYVLGGLQTIDREFGFGVDEATHHITDCHVAHHMFSDKPGPTGEGHRGSARRPRRSAIDACTSGGTRATGRKNLRAADDAVGRVERIGRGPPKAEIGLDHGAPVIDDASPAVVSDVCYAGTYEV